MRLAILCLVAFAVLPSLSRAQVPVFVILQEGSTVQFSVKASVAIEGKFDKWEATNVVQTGPNALEMPGTFTIRGVSKPERRYEKRGV